MPAGGARVAAGLLIAGALLVLAALRQLRHSYSEELTIRDGFRYAAQGPYRFTRHPMRCGVFLEAAGLAFISGTPSSACLAVLFGMLVLVRNRDDDQMLAEYKLFAAEAQRR